MIPKAGLDVGMHVSMCVCSQQEKLPLDCHYVGVFSSFQEAPKRSKETRYVEQASQNVMGRCLMLFAP